MADGDLRTLFRQYIADFHWQSVETGMTGGGVPDSNYCFLGVEGWVEFKQTAHWAVNMRPAQVGWVERRVRCGGRVFIAVRRRPKSVRSGPRPTGDELWVVPGRMVRILADSGLSGLIAPVWRGGPSQWHWPAVRALLLGS